MKPGLREPDVVLSVLIAADHNGRIILKFRLFNFGNIIPAGPSMTAPQTTRLLIPIDSPCPCLVRILCTSHCQKDSHRVGIYNSLLFLI